MWGEIVSLPGAWFSALPASSHQTFSSLPEMRIWAPAIAGSRRNAAPASPPGRGLAPDCDPRIAGLRDLA